MLTVLYTKIVLFCIPGTTWHVHFLCSTSPPTSFGIVPLESVITLTALKMRVWPHGNQGAILKVGHLKDNHQESVNIAWYDIYMYCY